MRTDIFIPSKIKVGFKNCYNAYDGKLSYITYFDAKGVLRKEKSWSEWRDSSIEPKEFENIPTSGLVLNKKAGGERTGWNTRNTYIRVHDPRGFEFEITVENLLYILDNEGCQSGKGLNGEYVYGWSNSQLILIPTSSSDYTEINEYTNIINTSAFVKPKELKVGCSYLTKDNLELVYMGKRDKYGYTGDNKGIYLWFIVMSNGKIRYTTTYKSASKKFIKTLSNECLYNFDRLTEELETNYQYSPIDHTKNEYVPYTIEEFRDSLSEYYRTYIDTEDKEYKVKAVDNDRLSIVVDGKQLNIMSVEEAFNLINPTILNIYLTNGRLYATEK